MLETYPVTLAFIVLKELDNSNIRSKDDYFKIMYSVCKKKIDEFIDKYLERSRGWRSDYIKINEKLKKIQTIVTSPKNISDECHKIMDISNNLRFYCDDILHANEWRNNPEEDY
jgi:hypothetical protein